MFFLLQTSPVF